MNKLVLYTFALFACCLLMTGCGGKKTNNMLAHVDSLIAIELDDSAMTVLKGIGKKELKNEGDAAYYNLLMAQVRYRLYLPPLPDSAMLDKSIEYFKGKGKNSELLARSYYYKGVTDEERGNIKSAILNLKNAENAIRGIDNDRLKDKILKSIAFINYRNNEYSIALEYGKKNLQLSQKRKNKTDIAYALDVIALAYSGLGQRDSADYYMAQIIPYLKYIREKERATLLNNIYSHSSEAQKIKTIEYLKESYRIDSNSTACSNLARYYYKMGMKEESEKMWKLAMRDTSLESQIMFTKNLIIQREDEGNYKEASNLSQKLISLTDSLKHKQQEEKIKDLQTEYDKQIDREKAESQTIQIVSLLIIILLAVTIVAIYNKRKEEKARTRLIEEGLQAQVLKNKIEKLEREKEENREKEEREKEREKEEYRKKEEISREREKEENRKKEEENRKKEEKDREKDRVIEEMKRALTKLNEKHAIALSKGRDLYEHIKNGGTVAKWQKSDFVDYIDFYWSVDMAFVSMLYTNYDKLSPKYQFFMILQHQGMTEEDIMRIMGIGKSSVRSIKSRINKNRK